MAYAYPGSELYEEIAEAGKSRNSRIIVYEGRVWKKRRDAEGPYFVSVASEPQYAPREDLAEYGMTIYED